MKNDGKIIKKVKAVKGGFAISRLFKVLRHSIELSIATKGTFTESRANDRKLKIVLDEYFIDEYPQYKYRFSVHAGYYLTDDEYEDVAFEGFDNFEDANKLYVKLVKEHNHQNHFYSMKRYDDHCNKNTSKFNYLSLLSEESKLL